jgi:diacylglycerol kinase family enzyme
VQTEKPRRVFIVLNTAAAGFLHRPVREICGLITSALAVQGISSDLVLAFDGSLEKHARAAVADGRADAVIAGGGDGTIGTVAAALVDTGIPLGILPLGRSNHFARDLGIPATLEDAVDVITAGHSAMIDTGEVNGRIFVNNSSLGAYPFFVLDRDRRHGRRGIQRVIALLLAAFRLLRLFPLRRFSVSAAEQVEIFRTPCLFVGNNRYQLEVSALGRRRHLDRGALWIYIARQQTRLQLVWFTFKSLLGLTDPARDLRVLHAASAEIGSRAGRLEVALDGEVVRMRSPLHYRIRPASLRVYAPNGRFRARGQWSAAEYSPPPLTGKG